MEKYLNKIIEGNFSDVLNTVKDSLAREDFEVLYEVDMQNKIREKLREDFNRYVILGASDIACAYKMLKKEAEIGTSLSCDLVIQQKNEKEIEVMIADPLCAMTASKNEYVVALTYEIKSKLTKVLESISISRNSEFYF
jgi:uncharacterized protein (DUF302 family)